MKYLFKTMSGGKLLNKIICGDCLDEMPKIADKSVDMILCDLPYGTTACKWDTIIPFNPLWEQYKRIIKDNGAIVLTASQPFTSALVMSNPDMFRYQWVWEKSKATGFAMAKNRPLKAHEDILIFCIGKENYYPQKTVGEPYKSKLGKKESIEMSTGTVRYDNTTGDRYPRSVQYFKTSETERNGFDHPTQKPVALFEYLIKTYTNEGDLVLDNCAGSGTTGVACINTKRNYILIEKDPEYVKIAEARINAIPNTLI